MNILRISYLSKRRAALPYCADLAVSINGKYRVQYSRSIYIFVCSSTTSLWPTYLVHVCGTEGDCIEAYWIKYFHIRVGQAVRSLTRRNMFLMFVSDKKVGFCPDDTTDLHTFSLFLLHASRG